MMAMSLVSTLIFGLLAVGAVCIVIAIIHRR
jgi:hypothetical protein